MTSNVAVIVGEELETYGFGGGHPFGRDRLGAFVREFEARGLPAQVQILPPRLARFEELASFHTEDYIREVKAASERGEGFLDLGDTPAFLGVYEAARWVVGASLAATEAILSGRCQRAFVPIAGLHHARPDGAAGFCVFNDCGIVIRHLRAAGIERVAYVDIDAHHGDGVFYAFEDDPQLIFADLHEDGRHLYPGTGRAEETGRGAATGTKLNLPLAPGANDATFEELWPQVIDHLARFEPGLIILQCGADSLGGDPLTHLQLTRSSHGMAARSLCDLAQSLGHGRVLALGGGGYNRVNLAQAWTAVVEGLIAA